MTTKDKPKDSMPIKLLCRNRFSKFFKEAKAGERKENKTASENGIT